MDHLEVKDNEILNEGNFFPKENSFNYSLHIYISLHQLSYCVIDEAEKNILYVNKIDFHNIFNFFFLKSKVKEVVTHSEHFQLKYKKIKISIFTPQFTLVPSELCEENSAKEYLEFNHPISAGDEIRTDSLRFVKAQNIYAVDSSFIKMLTDHFTHAQIMHSGTSLIDYLMFINDRQHTKTGLFIHIQTQWMEIIFIEDGALKFYNSFMYQATEDFIYYLSFAVKRLNVDPENIPVTLLGGIEKESGIYTSITKYFANVILAQKIQEYHYSKHFENTPSHYYYNLIALTVCG